MGRDLYIACKDCKEKMWVGQNKRFYDNTQIIEFLDKHPNHNLVYMSDYNENIGLIQGYKSVNIDFNFSYKGITNEIYKF